ncbi:hypothetical protein EV562_114235 [Streptomyces sp. BK208]|nr:hypothetical protein EV562_114235 [Streptomyces sp. BK208]
MALTKGTVYLTYNSATGKNCVVTVRNSSGAALYMTAEVAVADTYPNSNVQDVGFYTSYAGPVYVNAAGKCVAWGGNIDYSGRWNGRSNCG